MKITKKLLSILLVTTLMLTLLPATAQAAAAPKVKITWNANGGSVTPALRKVAYKKGYGTLPTPTRSGYTFDGWYTAASGGTKVSAVTKMAAKNVTVYAQWKNAQRVLSDAEKKLLGGWFRGNVSGGIYDKIMGTYIGVSGTGVLQDFYSDGTYHYQVISRSTIFNLDMAMKGDWYVKGNKIFKTNVMVSRSEDLGKTWSAWVPSSEPETSQKYELGADKYGEYLKITASDGTEEIPFRK